MVEPRARAGDSRQPLCRQTTAVTWSGAACAPTTQALCTACARCKPGEPEMEGGAWGGRGRTQGGPDPICARSPKYNSGQQCCYTADGTQLLTADSTGGSTPDRGHDWGSPPYRVPPRVPGLSHWIYDVISFYHCCLWAPECFRYMNRRPSSDCRSYRPPRLGGCWDGRALPRAESGQPTSPSDLSSLRFRGPTLRHFRRHQLHIQWTWRVRAAGGRAD